MAVKKGEGSKMGNPKQKWTAEEAAALLNGVAKYGPGRWKSILLDPDCAPFLTQRSNIDLKDKWRNLSVGSGGQGSRDRSRGAKRVKPLVKQDKPEKNDRRVYRDGALGSKNRTPKQKGVNPKHKYNQALVEAAAAAAYKVVEAENRSYLAAEAVKELERVSETAEYTYGMLQLLKEIHEHCLQGEVALLA